MRESDRKLMEYAAWLKESTDHKPKGRWTPISIEMGPEEYWAIVPMGIDETHKPVFQGSVDEVIPPIIIRRIATVKAFALCGHRATPTFFLIEE